MRTDQFEKIVYLAIIRLASFLRTIRAVLNYVYSLRIATLPGTYILTRNKALLSGRRDSIRAVLNHVSTNKGICLMYILTRNDAHLPGKSYTGAIGRPAAVGGSVYILTEARTRKGGENQGSVIQDYPADRIIISFNVP